MSETIVCPQCWTENPFVNHQCQVCGRYLRTLEEQQAILEKEFGFALSEPMKPRDESVPTQANPNPPPLKRVVPVPPAPPKRKSVVQNLFRPEVDENVPKPVLFLVDQGMAVRTTAFLIDLALIVAMAFVIPLWVAKVAGYQMDWISRAAAGGAFAWLYTSLMTISSYRATIGQCVLGIKVIDRKEDRRIGFVSASLRFVALLVSMASLLGVLWIGLTKSRRGWHDFIAGTRVVEPVWMIEDAAGQFVPYESSKRQWFSLLR